MKRKLSDYFEWFIGMPDGLILFFVYGLPAVLGIIAVIIIIAKS